MLYRLIVMTGPMKGQRITLEASTMVVGRDPGCDVCLPDEEIAQRHAELTVTPEGSVRMRDLGTMNRILVNGREVREITLRHGDLLEMGRTRLLLQASVEAEMPGVAPAMPARHRPRRASPVILLLLAGLTGWGLWALLRAPEPTPASEQAGYSWPPEDVDPLEPAALREAREVTEDSEAEAESEVVAPGIPSAPAGPTTAEWQRLVREMEALRDAVTNLAQPPPPAPPIAAAAVSPGSEQAEDNGVPDAAALASGKLLEDARAHAAAGHPDEADRLLARVQELSPEFLEAYEERATLFEQRGLLKRATDQWHQLAARTDDPATRERAESEALRLVEKETTLSATPRLRIRNVSQFKFPLRDEFDEMRRIDVELEPLTADGWPDVDAVQVEVTLFDLDEHTGRVYPSAVEGPHRLRPGVEQGDLSSLKLSATYALPKGTRASEEADGAASRFYGYVLRAYYNGVLQDEVGRPRELVDEHDPAEPSPAVPEIPAHE